jgi:mRNA-degrading endonuclease RelE of RelBE toxin-antitoxin system
MIYVIRFSKYFDPRIFKKLPKNDRFHIKKMIEQKLGDKPKVFGKPLQGSLKSCRSMRVRDYRVIFRFTGDTVDILLIEHRSVVYKKLKKRLKSMLE